MAIDPGERVQSVSGARCPMSGSAAPDTPSSRLGYAFDTSWERLLQTVASTAVGRQRHASALRACMEVFSEMDVGPIVKVFTTLLAAGAAVSVAVTAFFVMLQGSSACRLAGAR